MLGHTNKYLVSVLVTSAASFWWHSVIVSMIVL